MKQKNKTAKKGKIRPKNEKPKQKTKIHELKNNLKNKGIKLKQKIRNKKKND